jgi:hypothetical protein
MDDYFVVFVYLNSGKVLLREISFYENGIALIDGLKTRLGADMDFGLCVSTDWTSRILWPPSLAGQPYFRFDPVQPSTVLDKLKGRVFGPTLEYRPTEDVTKHCDGALRARKSLGD